MVTITIIGILTGAVMGALQMSRRSANESKTKSIIVKLNNVMMQRYESYMTRRVNIPAPAGLTAAQLAAWNRPLNAARRRLDAIRDLMRMEMPDSQADVVTPPTSMTYPYCPTPISIPEPGLHRLYRAPANLPTANFDSAQCLFMAVSMGSPEAMEQFNQSEIGTVTGTDAAGNPVTRRVFIDGWGTPIAWLRWAPGFVRPNSDIQTGNPGIDFDPFDPRRVDVDAAGQPRAFHLIPLICSAGANRRFGITDLDATTRGTILNSSNLFAAPATLGAPVTTGPNVGTHYDNITNHHIEQR